MYFLVINGLLAAFFLFLIFVAVRLKFWTFLPVNIFGLIIVSLTLYLDLNHLLTHSYILMLLFGLLVVFITDIIFTYQEFGLQLTERDQQRMRRYVLLGGPNEYFKIIGEEAVIKTEVEMNKEAPIPDRLQALEMIRQGNKAVQRNELTEALDKYNASTTWVETSIGYLNKSGVLIHTEKYEEALAMAEKAASLKDEFFEAYLNQGVAQEKLRKLDKAFELYKRAATIAPDEYEAWYCCANVLYKMNRFLEAIEHFDRAINLDGRHYEAWYYKGVCLQRTGKEVDALRCFEQVIKLNSTYSHAYYRAGNILNRLERNNEAIKAYEKAIKNNSEFIKAWNNLGVVLTKVGRIKDAVKCYERALKINPEYLEAMLNKGLALDSLGMYKKAQVSYSKFLELAPADMEKRIAITRKRLDEINAKYQGKKKQKKSGDKKKSKSKQAKFELADDAPKTKV